MKSGEGETSKGALSYAHDFYVHCYVGHFRRVHASNPPMDSEVEVANSSGSKTKIMVKASDPLAENGSLY